MHATQQMLKLNIAHESRRKKSEKRKQKHMESHEKCIWSVARSCCAIWTRFFPLFPSTSQHFLLSFVPSVTSPWAKRFMWCSDVITARRLEASGRFFFSPSSDSGVLDRNIEISLTSIKWLKLCFSLKFYKNIKKRKFVENWWKFNRVK